MPIDDMAAPLVRGRPYTATIDLDNARTFDASREPDLKINCNTFIVIKNDADDLDIAFNTDMMTAPLTVDVHSHDNIVIFRGTIDGVWLQHDAAAGGELLVLYGNDVYLDHSHKHMHTYTVVETESTATIAGSGAYTGSWIDCLDEGFTYIILTVFMNKNATLEIDQSHDGATVHRADTTTYTASATSGNMLKVQVMARYVRVKVTNAEATDATTVSIQRRFSQA